MLIIVNVFLVNHQNVKKKRNPLKLTLLGLIEGQIVRRKNIVIKTDFFKEMHKLKKIVFIINADTRHMHFLRAILRYRLC